MPTFCGVDNHCAAGAVASFSFETKLSLIGIVPIIIGTFNTQSSRQPLIFTVTLKEYSTHTILSESVEGGKEGIVKVPSKRRLV